MNSNDSSCCGESVPSPSNSVIYDDATCKVSTCRPMSLTERLVERKERLERDLNEVNIALEATTRNKEIFEALNAVARVFGDRIH